MNDGKALHCTTHPERDGEEIVSDLNSAAIEETTIVLPHDTIVMTPFIVRGRRLITHQEMQLSNDQHRELLVCRIRELSDTLAAWFVVSPPVFKWRIEPEITVERLFTEDAQQIQVYARGFFDVPVKLKDSQTIFMELP